ncbi:hypothetical protein [Clostridium butyricum]|uniref:hypothetical protein n=1 Tax=Clostridium butyricum TaxID=1492 RepID=UPI002AB1A80C|nr:hypothetical protein [Clostridium butyricum]
MLYKGQIFKCYKELCEEMQWKVYKSGSNSYKAQMKDLDTRCMWHKEERTFIIDEVYEKILVKKDNRRSKAIYIEDIKNILLYNLRNCDEYVSRNRIIHMLDVFENNYYNSGTLDYKEEQLYNLKVDEFMLLTFRMDVTREVQRIVDRALSSLKAQKIIHYDYGIVILNSEKECRFADKKENELIKKIEKIQLEEMHLKSKTSLKFKKLEYVFYKGVYEKLGKLGIEDVDRLFYGYKFISYDVNYAESLNSGDEEKSRMNLKKLLSERLIKFSQTTYKREVQKKYDVIAFGEPLFEDNIKTSVNYLQDFITLINYFIRMTPHRVC